MKDEKQELKETVKNLKELVKIFDEPNLYYCFKKDREDKKYEN